MSDARITADQLYKIPRYPGVFVILPSFAYGLTEYHNIGMAAMYDVRQVFPPHEKGFG